MSKVVILDGELDGIMKNPYGKANMCWEQLRGPKRQPSYPRNEAEIAQIFSVTSYKGRRWFYAPLLENLYNTTWSAEEMFEGRETRSEEEVFCDKVNKNNKALIEKLTKVAKPCIYGQEFVFSHSPVKLLVFDGELLGISNDCNDPWLDMEELVLKSRETIEERVKKVWHRWFKIA